MVSSKRRVVILKRVKGHSVVDCWYWLSSQCEVFLSKRFILFVLLFSSSLFQKRFFLHFRPIIGFRWLTSRFIDSAWDDRLEFEMSVENNFEWAFTYWMNRLYLGLSLMDSVLYFHHWQCLCCYARQSHLVWDLTDELTENDDETNSWLLCKWNRSMISYGSVSKIRLLHSSVDRLHPLPPSYIITRIEKSSLISMRCRLKSSIKIWNFCFKKTRISIRLFFLISCKKLIKNYGWNAQLIKRSKMTIEFLTIVLP